MFSYVFQQFEGESGQRTVSSQKVGECTLDDSMFRCFIHWYTKPQQNIQNQKKLLQTLAKQFNAILCILRISTEDQEIYNMIDLKSIEDPSKLPQFLSKALEVSKATFMIKKFRVLSICLINNFGSFQAEKYNSTCKDCGDQQKLIQCCGQFICWKCSKCQEVECCLYCSKKLSIYPVPLQIVVDCQSKNIYQPMLPYLSLQERILLKNHVDSQFDYN